VSRKVAILCTARKTVYKSLPDCDVYDIDRDARTFPGGMPIVAHPPCRSWSAHLRHQAKPSPGERELGIWCCDQLRECGGVLEQPARSHLFRAAGLPHPGESNRGDLFTIEVWQAWWGYPMRKATWLCFVGVEMDLIQCPLRLHPRGGDWEVNRRLSTRMRSETTIEFAVWLVGLARKSSVEVASHA